MGLRRERRRIAQFRLTAALVTTLAHEIDGRAGDRVRGVHEDAPLQFRLGLEGRAGRMDLHVSVSPDRPAVYLAAHLPAPKTPSPFANRLRALLKRARLVGARAVPGERALAIHFERGGEEHVLWVELFGRQANLYLVDALGSVLLTPRGAEAERRENPPGGQFSPIPANEIRIDPTVDAAAETDAPPLPASAKVQAATEAAGDERSLGTLRTAIRRIIRSGQKAAGARVTRLEQALERVDEARVLRERGELLRGSFHLLKPGRTEVIVTDYLEDPPTEITIELDPQLTPGEQVGRCFSRAQKLVTAAERATHELPAARTALATLEAAPARLEATSDEAAVRALIETLPAPVDAKARGTLRALVRGTTRRAPVERIPWRAYVSADGWEIRVGKSAADSDALTLRRSKPHDLFLHIRSVPGAHVIIPTQRGKTVPKETLLDAAELACMFSKRDAAEHNEVDYVERRFVRKPKGGKPGLVQLDRTRTLSLRLDDNRRTRLRASRKDIDTTDRS